MTRLVGAGCLLLLSGARAVADAVPAAGIVACVEVSEAGGTEIGALVITSTGNKDDDQALLERDEICCDHA